MVRPGEKVGKMDLPASYSLKQLGELKWCEVTRTFGKRGGVSSLDNADWKDRGNRSRTYSANT